MKNNGMPKKVLMVATVASMIGQFNMNNIKILQNKGFIVYVACDFKDLSVWNIKRINAFIKDLEKLNIKYYQIDFPRNPLKIIKIFKALKQMEKLILKEKINIIHCHTPVAGVISRVIGHKLNIKVIYTVHGFHFYKGAPKLNWLVYYPIEKFLSRWTNLLITINKEDYKIALEKFHAASVFYIPGVGIDMSKFNSNRKKGSIRKEFNIDKSDILLLSVGELSRRKNQKIVLDALRDIKDTRLKYFIVGQGDLKQYYEKIVIEYKLERQVFLLGFRTDISDLCNEADVFVFPSKQEGLPVALMEAIACKCPVIVSSIRGNVDLISKNTFCFAPTDEKKLLNYLKVLLDIDESIDEFFCKDIEWNYNHLKLFSEDNINSLMEKIYGDIENELS